MHRRTLPRWLIPLFFGLVLVLGLALLLSGCESGKKEAEQADKPKVESAAATSKAEAPASRKTC